jgi:hypothetical protein
MLQQAMLVLRRSTPSCTTEPIYVEAVNLLFRPTLK